ncbi:p25-alpha domain-containing [Chlorella sorokiniana]|uniref:P25-alpha domain-containing n=1 Tax=Chlorella sorokiniana TaxID=3076 RepID=A0A2P6TRC6_CHLSO|nr:p25-alpha domain-containing [Chlorella sorokiniana]|eukprot:PRW56603.1 p25-alpha domain-containing [Chlorella sorokiniana]
MPLLGCNRASDTSTAEKPPRRSRFSLFSRKNKAALKDSGVTEPTAEVPPLQEAPAADPSALNPEDLACLASTAAPSEASEVPAEAPAAAAARAIAERAAALAEAALDAKAHRSACLSLADLGTAVAALVQDPAATCRASPTALERVACLMADGAALATSCAAPGWLLAAATPEGGACEAMAALHAGVLASLKDSGLDRLALLRLPQADYPTGASAARALHRRLRQLGGGSLREGLAVVATSEQEQRSLAAALSSVEPEAVRADAEHILEAGLAPPDTASAASAAAAGDAAVAAHRAALERVFAAYATYGAREAAVVELDSFRCAKLCREAGLLAPGGGLTAQELDVLFAKAKDRAARKLTFAAFLRLLALAASKKGAPLAEVAAAVAGLHGPTATGATEPEYVRFHDDCTTYTGMHARGGMSVVDDKIELSKMVDRDAAEKASRRASLAKTPIALSRTTSGAATPRDGGCATPRGAAAAAFSRPGVPRLALPAEGSGQTTPRLSGEPWPTPPQVRPLTSRQQGAEDAAALRRVFEAFSIWGKSAAQAASGGEPCLDSAQLQKLCRDAELLNRQLTATRLDLLFASAAGKGGRRLSYPAFAALLPRLAEARCCTEAEVVRRIAGCQGPSRTATTTPEAVRLADRANFTGVAARGGPSTVDDRVTLANLTDRSGRK